MYELTGRNFIGSHTANHDSTQTFKAINPSSNTEIEPAFYSASHKDVDNAVEQAKVAFQTYKGISGAQKAVFLETIADNIMALGDALTERAMLETALPKGRLEGERGRTIGQLKMFAELIREGSWAEASIDTSIPDRSPVPKPDLRKMLVPTGPVVVFGASNFPLAFSTAGGDTASALAAGNPVIVKAHNSHPGTSEMVASAILKAAGTTGMPDGVFSHLLDSGFAVGKSLVLHTDIKTIGFTGSFTGGKALFDLASSRKEPIPVFAEMGSINPVFILPDALTTGAEEIAISYATSITQGVGQFCTNPGLLISLKSGRMDTFTKSLDETLQGIVNAPMLNKGIYGNYEQKKNQVLEQNGIEVISRVAAVESSQNNNPETLIASVEASEFISNPTLHEEIFGPYSLLIKCNEEDDLINIAENLKGQLTITVMATEKDLSEHQELITKLQEKTGRLILNGVPTGVEVCASMHHGGPFPATTDSRFSSVGTSAIKRFVRPLSFQNFPDTLLPMELRNDNPLKIWRMIDNNWTKEPVK